MALLKPMHPVVEAAGEEELRELIEQARRKLRRLSGRGAWDDESEERLRFLWLKTGRTLRAIARELDLTPGQVSGKLSRLGLLGHTRPSQ